MPPNAKPTNTNSRKLKILMLHGYTQSGPLFQAKTQRIKKLLEKSLASVPINSSDTAINGIDLIYPTGPFSITSADMNGAEVRDDANGWWKLRDRGEPQDGIDEGLSTVAKTLKEHGPFDGVMGFSQGAALTAMVVSLLEPGREDAFAGVAGGMQFPDEFRRLRHPMLRFGVCFSGLVNKCVEYSAFYEPKIQTPVLHVLGSMDTIVEESESLALADRCVNGDSMVIRHAGTHTVPSSERDIAAVIQFIRNVYSGGDVTGKKDEEEEDVLDMDMPF